MTIIAIIGASGVVGARVLHHLLVRGDVARVVALGRRALSLQHEKLTSTIVDLQSPPAMARHIPRGVTVAICCVGTTMKQAGSKAAFRAVDHDVVAAFGRAALECGSRRFVLVSSLGASPSSHNFYLKTKGEAEQTLARLGYAQLTIVRPSFIDDEGARSEHRPAERLLLPISRAAFGVLGKMRRYAPITADTVAKAVVRAALDETTEQVRIFESEQLHAIAG